MGEYTANMGCGGGDENKGDEVVVEDGAAVGPAVTKVKVFVSADADSPNYIIKMLAYDWMTIGHVARKVQDVLTACDQFEGDCEFVTGIGPFWGDGWDVFPMECNLWEVDGFDMEDDDQMFLAHTETLNPEFYGGFDFEAAET